MSFFVTINSDQVITAFFIDEIGYAVPPKDAIKISDKIGNELKGGFSNFKLINGSLVSFVPPVLPPNPMDYAKNRVAEYPPISDYLDGVVKGDTAQVQAYVTACLQVKMKYPKPPLAQSNPTGPSI